MNAAQAISEDAARQAKQARSLAGYREGSATSEHEQAVQEIRQLAEQRKQEVDETYHERIDQLADRYAAILATQTNEFNERSARIPSVMLTGPANYPAEKMARRTDSMMRHYARQDEQLERTRAAILACGSSISSTQANAEQLLAEKLARLEARQTEMKQANKKARASNEPAPYESFTLSNNNANMRRIRQRIESIRRHKAAGRKERTGTMPAGEPFTLVQDGEEGYTYFQFDAKPGEATRGTLKHHGFHYSPRLTRWQRKTTGGSACAIRAILAQCQQTTNQNQPETPKEQS